MRHRHNRCQSGILDYDIWVQANERGKYWDRCELPDPDDFACLPLTISVFPLAPTGTPQMETYIKPSASTACAQITPNEFVTYYVTNSAVGYRVRNEACTISL